MSQQSGPVSPREDDQLAHETRGLVQGGHSTRAEEWRDPEPAGEDQPGGEREIGFEDRAGAPAGMDPQDVETRSEIARFLDRTALPGDRDDLLAAAREHQATDRVIRLLEQLPADARFENVQAVSRALGLGTEERRS